MGITSLFVATSNRIYSHLPALFTYPLNEWYHDTSIPLHCFGIVGELCDFLSDQCNAQKTQSNCSTF